LVLGEALQVQPVPAVFVIVKLLLPPEAENDALLGNNEKVQGFAEALRTCRQKVKQQPKMNVQILKLSGKKQFLGREWV